MFTIYFEVTSHEALDPITGLKTRERFGDVEAKHDGKMTGVRISALSSCPPGVLDVSQDRVRRLEPGSAPPHAEGVQLREDLPRGVEPDAGRRRGRRQDR